MKIHTDALNTNVVSLIQDTVPNRCTLDRRTWHWGRFWLLKIVVLDRSLFLRSCRM